MKTKNTEKVGKKEEKKEKKKTFFFSNPACRIKANSQEEAIKKFNKKYSLK